ncbi:MAG: putative metal-dependent hydrolase [Cyclobacteriaceae bacterium]|nr:putative metal-dependent hydrolase [Cyclobacteriaceae bacterium SS2]
MIDIEKLKYPVGNFSWPTEITLADLDKWISEIEAFPSLVSAEMGDLPSDGLDWRYRPDGWTIRQVIHHCADSHFNSFVRFKLALTEDNPTIKPYEESLWAKLPDSLGPIESSLSILTGLHKRWVVLLRSLDRQSLGATYFHPEQNASRRLDGTIGLYAWHCNHHLAHIRQAKEAQGKYN